MKNVSANFFYGREEDHYKRAETLEEGGTGPQCSCGSSA